MRRSLGRRCANLPIGAPTAQAAQLGAGVWGAGPKSQAAQLGAGFGGLRQTVDAVFHQARLLALASWPGLIPRRDGLGVLALLDPGQNLAQPLVLDDRCVADPLQLVEHGIG